MIIFFSPKAAPLSEPPDSVGAGVTHEEDDGQLPKCCRGCQSKHNVLEVLHLVISFMLQFDQVGD